MNDDRLIRLFDILVSLLFLCLTAFWILIVMIGAIFFAGFPPVYLSRRAGKGGVLFRHYKIRSMKPGKEWGRSYFEQERLSLFGRLIRKMHLDELPELFLILAGKMSLVGPRPLPPSLIQAFDTKTREQVLPGWTCLAQLKLARKGILYGPEQILLDNIYVKRRCLKYNCRILLETLCISMRPRKQVMDTAVNDYRKEYRKQYIQ